MSDQVSDQPKSQPSNHARYITRQAPIMTKDEAGLYHDLYDIAVDAANSPSISVPEIIGVLRCIANIVQLAESLPPSRSGVSQAGADFMRSVGDAIERHAVKGNMSDTEVIGILEMLIGSLTFALMSENGRNPSVAFEAGQGQPDDNSSASAQQVSADYWANKPEG